jgi:hypothetical protein
MAWRRAANERQHTDFIIGREVTLKPWMCYMCLRVAIKVKTMSTDVEYVARLGRKRGRYPTFVTFTNFQRNWKCQYLD